MFGWLSSLFTPTTVETTVETGASLLKSAASGIDKMFYTEEERADAKVKFYELWLKSQAQAASESPIRGITRRLIAVPWMFLQMFLILATISGYFFDQKFSILCVDIMRENIWITGTIVVFYFGPYMAEMILSKLKK